MHIDFNHVLIIQKTHAVLMLSIRHLIYVSIYVRCLRLIFYEFKMICILNHNIMLLATSLLRIYPNYVLCGMYEIGDCLYVTVLALFYHSSYPSLYVNFVSQGNIVHRHISHLMFSLNNRLYHVFRKCMLMNMYQVMEIMFSSSY